MTGLLTAALLLAQTPDPADIRVYWSLKTHLKGEGKLVVARFSGEDSGLPVEAFQYLFVVASPIRRYRIRGMRDFRGLLTIRSEADALEFVRLRTSPVTYHVFWEDPVLEILPQSKANLQTVWGYKRKLYYVTEPLWLGQNGIITDSIAKKWGYVPPIVTKTDKGFRVERWVVCFESTAPRGWQGTATCMVEEVGKDAKYAEISRTPLPVGNSFGGWSFPSYK